MNNPYSSAAAAAEPFGMAIGRLARRIPDGILTSGGGDRELGSVQAHEVLDAQRFPPGDPLYMVVRSLKHAVLIVLRNLAEVLHEMSRRVRIGGELSPKLRYLLRHISHLASQRLADALGELVVIHLARPEQRIGLAGVRPRLTQDGGNHAPLVFGGNRRMASAAK